MLLPDCISTNAEMRRQPSPLILSSRSWLFFSSMSPALNMPPPCSFVSRYSNIALPYRCPLDSWAWRWQPSAHQEAPQGLSGGEDGRNWCPALPQPQGAHPSRPSGSFEDRRLAKLQGGGMFKAGLI